MSKYLEKIATGFTKEALTAMKARQMAKQVGIIPEAGSAWKYALRNLRDGRGNPLVGKQLAEKRVALHDVSHNAYQKLLAKDRTEGSRGIEFTGRLDRKGKLEDGPHMGGYGAVDRSSPLRSSDNIHTHPAKGIVKQIQDGRYFGKDYKGPQLTHPSGSEGQPKFGNREFHRDLHNLDRITHQVEGRQNRILAKIRQSGPADELVNQHRILSSKADTAFDSFYDKHGTPGLSGDLRNMRRNPYTVERIAAPSVHTVSANKLTKGGLRTIYFDHTPRKTKQL